MQSDIVVKPMICLILGAENVLSCSLYVCNFCRITWVTNLARSQVVPSSFKFFRNCGVPKCLPLEMTRGGSTLPEAEMHGSSVTESRLALPAV